MWFTEELTAGEVRKFVFNASTWNILCSPSHPPSAASPTCCNISVTGVWLCWQAISLFIIDVPLFCILLARWDFFPLLYIPPVAFEWTCVKKITPSTVSRRADMCSSFIRSFPSSPPSRDGVLVFFQTCWTTFQVLFSRQNSAYHYVKVLLH